MSSDPAGSSLFRSIVDPWYESLKNPLESQRRVLMDLLDGYAKTRYGVRRGTSEVEGIADFQTKFPVMNYKEFSPYIAEVERGDYSTILSEPLLCWVMTRGSTGPAKVLPVTGTHIKQILTCGARALVNHAFRTGHFELFKGKILNLSFPSKVHTTIIDGKKATYGYSSGTYAKLIPAIEEIELLPRQEDIDALGSGITKKDWEKRFELTYQQTLHENVTAAMGVTPVILSFARYVKKNHGKKLKDVWNLLGLFCTSVRKIQFKYGPMLRKYFGNVPVVEIYSATEGVFAQQLDSLPYVTPNYDTYFFEVEIGRETKMLCELKSGDWGKLVVSSCIFPRYAIGDMIESAGKNYFRIFGRENPMTILEHRLYRLFFGWSV